MFIVVRKDDDTLVDIVDHAEVVSNGLQVVQGGKFYVYAYPETLTVREVTEISSEITVQDYKHTALGFTRIEQKSKDDVLCQS